RKGPLLSERAFVVSSARLGGQALEATDVADRIGVSFTAVVAEVATGPVGADAVDAVDVVVSADAVVPAVAAHVGVGAGELLLQLGVAVTAASEQFQLVADRVLADHVTGGVPLMLDRAVDAGDGDAVVLDAHGRLGFDGQVTVQAHAPAAGHGDRRGGG